MQALPRGSGRIARRWRAATLPRQMLAARKRGHLVNSRDAPSRLLSSHAVSNSTDSTVGQRRHLPPARLNSPDEARRRMTWAGSGTSRSSRTGDYPSAPSPEWPRRARDFAMRSSRTADLGSKCGRLRRACRSLHTDSGRCTGGRDRSAHGITVPRYGPHRFALIRRVVSVAPRKRTGSAIARVGRS